MIRPSGFSLLHRLVAFEALKLFDEVKLERRTQPSGKLKSDITMSERPSIPARFGLDSNGLRFFDPPFDGQDEGIFADLQPNLDKPEPKGMIPLGIASL